MPSLGLELEVILFSLLLVGCQRSPTSIKENNSATAASAASTYAPMITDPTTVDLAAGKPTFVWFYATY